MWRDSYSKKSEEEQSKQQQQQNVALGREKAEPSTTITSYLLRWPQNTKDKHWCGYEESGLLPLVLKLCNPHENTFSPKWKCLMIQQSNVTIYLENLKLGS